MQEQAGFAELLACQPEVWHSAATVERADRGRLAWPGWVWARGPEPTNEHQHYRLAPVCSQVPLCLVLAQPSRLVDLVWLAPGRALPRDSVEQLADG